MTEEKFDELLKNMREESATAEEIAGARQRVWDRLTGSTSALCFEFRPELGAYLDERLTDSRRLLLEDHLGRCADCRRALAEAKGKPRVVAARTVASRGPGWMRWAVAASVVLAVLYLGRDQIDRALAPAGARATVVSVSGEVFRLPQSELEPGAALFEDDVIRTGAGAHAVLELADGSRLEVNQRTKLSVHSAWSGQTVRLDYGDLLMEAAEQRRGRLRVVTRDSIASVKGTIFAVSSATAGSLVSVVEGSVEVLQPGARKLLEPGQQAASNLALESVGIEQAISWSQDAEKYYGLLAEIMLIEKDLAELPGSGLRTQARLLPYLPVGTRVYIAIPNLNGTIRQAVSLMDQRAGENELLDEWWSSEAGRELRGTLDRMQAIAPLLGDEILFVFAGNPGELSGGIPLLLAEVQTGREDSLREAIGDIAVDGDISYEVAGGLLLISDSSEHLTIMKATLGGGASSAFAGAIAGRYQHGVSWLTGVDVATLGSDMQMDSEAERVVGLPSMRYLFFEQRSEGGAYGNEVTLSFSEARSGVASWLASPGPAGSAEYVSSEAVAALSASMRDPRQAFDEILSLLGEDSELAAEIDKFESESGISISLDIAASLGTDVTFAIERPSVPVPGWIVAFETINPGALDETARRLVETYNESLDAENADYAITLGAATVNGRTWRSITTGDSGAGLHWTYDRGYFIGSMDRAVAMRAIAVRESGSPLIYTGGFQQRFPATSNLHHSGFLWFNTNGVVADLASLVESPALKSLLDSREPMLVVFDGEAEQIHAASRTRLTSLLLDMLLVSGVAHAAPPSGDSISSSPDS